MNTITTLCVNGELQVGDLVLSTPSDDYAPCMIGRVLKINLLGTPEHDEETENDTDAVHVDFMEFEYSDQRVKEIEELLSELYGEEKTLDSCPLDDIIMAPDTLIRITGIDEKLLHGLLDSGYNAACYCYDTLFGQLGQNKPGHIPENEDQAELKLALMDVIESAVTLAGYEALYGDEDSFIIRHGETDIDYEINVIEVAG